MTFCPFGVRVTGVVERDIDTRALGRELEFARTRAAREHPQGNVHGRAAGVDDARLDLDDIADPDRSDKRDPTREP